MPTLLILFVIFFMAVVAVFLFKILNYAFAYFFWGAIYVPTSEKRVVKMIDFLDLNRSDKKAVDLGAGDGRLVIALAKAGVEAHGFEINPFLVFLARKNIKKARLDGKAFMHFKNLWKQDLGEFDIVVLYAMKHMMAMLEKKYTKN